MDLLSTSTVSLVSGTFLVNFRLIREPFLLFLAEWIYFSLFVTQLAMPTPFNVTNMDQKKPNRWAPLLNYWKVWFIINRVFITLFFRTYDSIQKLNLERFQQSYFILLKLEFFIKLNLSRKLTYRIYLQSLLEELPRKKSCNFSLKEAFKNIIRDKFHLTLNSE